MDKKTLIEVCEYERLANLAIEEANKLNRSTETSTLYLQEAQVYATLALMASNEAMRLGSEELNG